MPLPRWLARVNRRVFNPMEIRRRKRPVITHVGRNSGATYRTPLDAHEVERGYIFILVYGSRSDWVRNILAAGDATLTVDGMDVALTAPRLIDSQEAWEALPPGTKAPPGFLKVDEFLRMDLAS